MPKFRDNEERTDGYTKWYEAFRHRVTHVQEQVDTLQKIQERLASGEEFSIRVTDHTLMPFIQPNDLMIFRATNYEKIKLGDFVMYRLSDGRPAVRRVIRKALIDRQAALICRSDVDHNEKDQIRAAQVMARLECIERHGRRIKGSRLNRGIIDWATSFGTRHPLSKLGDLFMLLLPISSRRTEKLEGVKKVEAPAKGKARARGRVAPPARRKTSLDD